MNKALLVVVLAGAIGVGVYLYSRRASAGGGGGGADFVEGPPDRVRQKRAAGAAMATTSDAYRPQLPAGAQDVVDTAALAYKRGSDLVSQGQSAVDAYKRGDYSGAAAHGVDTLASFGGIAGGVFGKPTTSSYKPNATTIPKSAPAPVQAKAAVGQIIAGGRTISNVRGPDGTVFRADQFASTPEFQKLRAAADAQERKANVGAGHF